MTIERRRPKSEPFSDWVEDYAQRDVTSPSVVDLVVMPTMRVELLFHFGDPFQCAPLGESAFLATVPATILNARAERARQRAGPHIDWFLVGLTPLGCRQLLGAPVSEFRRAPIALGDVWGARAAQLWEALREERTLAARWRLFCDAARQGVLADVPNGDFLRALAPRRLAELKRVRDLPQQLGLSSRRVRQLAQEELGASVKTILSIQRMNAQLEELHRSGAAPLTRTSAHEFADQSHASREFRRATGVTPSFYARRKAQDGDALVYTVPAKPTDADL